MLRVLVSILSEPIIALESITFRRVIVLLALDTFNI
jgi:hypothetical protein